MGRYDKIKGYSTSFNTPNRIRIKGYTFPIRYIYIYQNGSTANVGNHLCQVEAYDLNGVNVAVGATVTGSSAITNPQNCVKETLDTTYAETAAGSRQWFIIDLGKPYMLSNVKVWRYYPDGRTYYETAICCLNEGRDKEFRIHVYDQQGLYAENTNGYDGTWIDYGSNDSSITRPIHVHDGTNWVRKSLNKVERQTGTSYTFTPWSRTWPSGAWAGASNATYFASGEYNCSVPSGYATWGAYSSYLVGDNGYANWWASSGSNYPNVWRNFYWRRSTRHWIHNYVFRSANTNLWTGCPSQCEVWAGEKATYIGTYGFSNPGNRNVNFYTLGVDYKPNGGITSSAIAIYDGSGWKRANYSMRMGAFQYETGNAISTPIYTTYWE